MSNKCKANTTPVVSLMVDAESLPKFTTLLQSGIFIHVKPGETIGDLLGSLPGFTEKYIGERVQTIFVDGLPADDLTQQFSKKETVLAISAAMPGLAGAIFRKGGKHAALRTKAKQKETAPAVNTSMNVRLKLFNAIAKERGEALLGDGCFMRADSLEKFLNYRPPLVASIQKFVLNGRETTVKSLLQTLAATKTIALTINSSDAS